jgi:hypothetical protein
LKNIQDSRPHPVVSVLVDVVGGAPALDGHQAPTSNPAPKKEIIGVKEEKLVESYSSNSTTSHRPVDGTRQWGLPLAKIDDFRATSGFGAEALVMGQKVRRS